MTCVIVLAGGESRRFKSLGGKALIKIQGRSLIRMVMEKAAEASSELILSVRSRDQFKAYERELAGIEFKVVFDEEVGGPIKGIISGLKASDSNYCLTLPVDHPFIKVEVLDTLFKRCVGKDVASIVWPSGRVEPLLTCLNKSYALRAFRAMSTPNPLRVDNLIRGGFRVALINVNEFLSIDPQLNSFRNVNRFEDLSSWNPSMEGNLLDSIEIRNEPVNLDLFKSTPKINSILKRIHEVNNVFWKACFLYGLSRKFRYLKLLSGELYLRESLKYLSLRLNSLALHASLDSKRCIEEVGVKSGELNKLVDELRVKSGLARRNQ